MSGKLDCVHRAIGLFSDRSRAEAALKKLKKRGIDMKKVFVINQDCEGEAIQKGDAVFTQHGQIKRAAGVGSVMGSVGGSALGLLAGVGILAIPGIGVAAELVFVAANIAVGGALGAAGGGLGGAVVGWGMAKDRAKYCRDRAQYSDQYLVVVQGSATAIQTAQAILSPSHPPMSKAS